MADITLTFAAIGAEKVAAEIKKIQESIKGAMKGFDSTGADAAKKAATAAKDLKESLDVADGAAGDVAENLDELDGKSERAGDSMGSLGRSSGNVTKGFLGLSPATVALGAALAGVAAAVGIAKKGFDMLVDGVNEAFKTGQEFSKMAAALGIDAGSARLLGQAFTEAGMSAQSVVPMVSKMQRKVAEGSAAFKVLGLDVEALKGKSAVEQMEAIGEAVRKVSDQEGKMKVLMAIFEEAGPQLSKFFNNPQALDNASETLGSSVQIMRENAEAFDRAAVLISNVGVKIGTFFEGVAAGIVGPLNALLNALNKVDLANIGKKFGNAVKGAVELYYKAFLNDQFFALLAAKFGAASSSFWADAREVWAPVQDAFNGTVAGTAALVETGLDFAGRGLDKLGVDGTNGLTSRVGLKDAFMNYTNENLRAAKKATNGVGDFFTDRKKEWAELEAAFIRSIKRDLEREKINPGDDFDSSKTKIDLSGFKLDLSGLMKDSAGISSFTPQVDALARVGGTIGGMSGAQLAPARKTADNTSRLVNLTNEIRSTLKMRSAGTVATYA